MFLPGQPNWQAGKFQMGQSSLVWANKWTGWWGGEGVETGNIRTWMCLVLTEEKWDMGEGGQENTEENDWQNAIFWINEVGR